VSLPDDAGRDAARRIVNIPDRDGRGAMRRIMSIPMRTIVTRGEAS
jgi:hypothetical protein